ncbi:related to nitrogen metabolic regulation protein nmr [Phialocephala subalpina]|uniref:Related to nitrogen metabolic regulation protein nmr n=1 Tax=Phialocephala subalpina TaxID=576137 RepID=A0A1L7WVF7_9HELO|nr:related to nitrogen metabolic regulation protein nmr [Phialocephala subalpina]
MSSKKLLVVFGATGNQGGSVILTVLSDPFLSSQFQLRGITRDPTKPSAAALSSQGVELVKADLDDKESLKKALEGAYAVFAVTNWQEVLDKKREVQQGKNIADVAKEVGVQQVIWSSLPNVSKITGGKNTGVLHFDSKAVVEEYMKSIGLPATFLLLGVFFHYSLFQLVPTSSDPAKKSYTLKVPLPLSTKYALIDANKDVGKYVKSILLNRDALLGKQVLGGVREYSIEEAAGILRDVGGLDVKAAQVSEVEYRGILAAVGFPEFLQDDMVSNMKYIEEYGFFGGEDVKRDHHLLTEPLETFEQWVASSPAVAAMK